MSYHCRYCGRRIRKFLIGWLHVNDDFGFFPTTMHIASPREKTR